MKCRKVFSSKSTRAYDVSFSYLSNQKKKTFKGKKLTFNKKTLYKTFKEETDLRCSAAVVNATRRKKAVGSTPRTGEVSRNHFKLHQ